MSGPLRREPGGYDDASSSLLGRGRLGSRTLSDRASEEARGVLHPTVERSNPQSVFLSMFPQSVIDYSSWLGSKRVSLIGFSSWWISRM